MHSKLKFEIYNLYFVSFNIYIVVVVAWLWCWNGGDSVGCVCNGGRGG